MDLRFTDDELAFRDEVRDFFRSALPDSIRRKMIDGHHPSKEDLVTWTRILNAKGWAVPHWPVEWGGTDWSPVKQYIFREELQKTPAPEPLAFGVNMVGPVIYTFGNEEQKRRFLPRIANLDDWWCQGFSEPGAGSDLASLKTTARRDGDHYIVNGQKTWTTLAQHADWIFCLVRTDSSVKKQEGISFLLVDMKTPGVTVRPIQTIDGDHEVNEVFFDDVRVPAENLVGQENKGWDYAKFLLSNERVGIARIGISKARLRRVRELASLERVGDVPLIEIPRFREKLAAVEVELKALEMTQLRVVAGESRREKGKPDPASSILKIKGSEIQQATTELLMEVVGPFALPYHPEEEGRNEPIDGPDWASTAAPTYFNWRKVSIYGGSNEIQKNIIAKAILGF
ncbi:pimeloyl-CoA dehydrogenase large subunit [Microvirga arsenatis]|uniref:Pimeloyl-CoA dehydrogenase large subunit n=1 Tax=Microvirga arsenatis TaxID=2692265 RepID=A0ABW9YTI9_9HYPH|nr:pimeloyl-CoA dehydrogenase large subunit [Microvirga arsenatis]NBJ09590.1 pimeloyl-CoA dehydrogenase large subunit [Microvirga arsenatis]NBJ23551.1 pimeloyl-CoA dehydrogenase large subunit [Microvirga arsenatis]